MIPIAKPEISDEEIREVEKVLRSGYLVSGKKVKEFEKNFAHYIGVKHAIATSTGTSALHTALLSLGIGKGDEVITTPFSFISSSNCILFVGAKPVFVDIDERTFNIDSNKIEEKITERTKAVLPVHLFGQPCEIKKISEICDDHGLFLIEDSCQAHGAEYEGKKVGSFGDVSCFSFYATKNMPIGEGGMITTNDEEIAEKARIIVNQGQKKKYNHAELGFNYRMMELQAVIGLGQLKKLDERNEKRIKNAAFLTKNLLRINYIKTPFISPNVKHIFHQYTIRCRERDKLQTHLLNEGIQTMIYYPISIHKQPLYQKLGFNIRLEKSEKAAREVFSVPVYSSLSKKDLEKIVKSIKSFQS